MTEHSGEIEPPHVCRYTRPAGSPPTVTDDFGNVWCSSCPTLLHAGDRDGSDD